jgi:hypothetical protein
VKLILRGFALVVTDRRWAAPLSAAALGFGIFAGVAIGPGATGTLATGAQQIVQLPGSGGDEVHSGGGGGPVASTESSPPLELGESGGEEAIPSSVPLVPEPVEPPPAPEPTPKPAAAPEDEEEETSEEAQDMKGTVVHTNPAAGSYTMAVKGELVSIHAPKLPEPGTKLSSSFTRLANDTFTAAEDPKTEKASAAEATFRGVVTYTDPDPAAPAYTLSGRGSSLLIHVPPDPTGATPILPPIGTYATVTATLDTGLQQKKLEPEPGPPSTYLDLAGVVKEILPDGHLVLSADDSRESEADLTLTVPPGIDASKLKPGDSYLATAEVDPNGPLKLSGIASDEHTKGADDLASAQGDLKR